MKKWNDDDDVHDDSSSIPSYDTGKGSASSKINIAVVDQKKQNAPAREDIDSITPISKESPPPAILPHVNIESVKMTSVPMNAIDSVSQKVMNWKSHQSSEAGSLSEPSEIHSEVLLGAITENRKLRFPTAPMEHLSKPKQPRTTGLVPSDQEILSELRGLMKSVDITQQSARSLREALEKRFNCDLGSKTLFIRESIHSILNQNK